MRPVPSLNVFDATLQTTVFSSDVQEKHPGMDRDNAQLRIGATVAYRKIDEETNPWPPKKNRSVGLMVVGKVYSRALRSTILGSVGVDLKEFTQLQTTEVLGSARIGIGF